MKHSRILSLVVFVFLTFLGSFVFVERSYSVSASFAKRDDVITAQLQAKIAADPQLSKFRVDIDTIKAVVSIHAVVETSAQANKLVILANSIAGVDSVDASDIVVKPLKKAAVPQPGAKTKAKNAEKFTADSVITSQVIGLYIREGLIDPANPLSATINVQTRQGIVYLTGTVTSDAAADNAVKLAQTITGVVDVQSSLTTVSP